VQREKLNIVKVGKGEVGRLNQQSSLFQRGERYADRTSKKIVKRGQKGFPRKREESKGLEAGT